LQPDVSRDEVRFSGGQVVETNGKRSFSFFVPSYSYSFIIVENPADPNVAGLFNKLMRGDLEKWLATLAVCPAGHRVTQVEAGFNGTHFLGECD
jgi:hypothetical protein